ncbi:Tspear [Symbiodinium microadriaticum]|nr:Tspear [Symbiodinium sp. KB8]CAE7874009.1 Tspear [Symbiodinium microadriaticum]
MLARASPTRFGMTRICGASSENRQPPVTGNSLRLGDLAPSSIEAPRALPTRGAWALTSFRLSGEVFLAVASFFDGASRKLSSRVYRWDVGLDMFVWHQVGPGRMLPDHAWNMEVNLLSAAEAHDFACRHGIDLTGSRKEVLNAVAKAVSAMPFHNLDLLATNPGARKPPTAQAVKASMLRGQGGLCFVKQPFVGHLLQALGYAVEVLPGAVTHPGNHVIVVVHDVQEEGDRYLVEAGCGYPSSQAVCIDDDGHKGFEQVFQDSFREEPGREPHPPGASMIAVKDAILLEEDEDGKVVSTQLHDAEGIRKKLILHFPEMKRELLDAALAYWHCHIHVPRVPA